MPTEDLGVKVAELEQRAKSNTRRIDKLEQSQEALTRLVSSVEVMAEKLNQMAKSVDKLDDKVEHLEAKPGKRWESLADKAIWAIAGGLIAFLLAQLGI